MYRAALLTWLAASGLAGQELAFPVCSPLSAQPETALQQAQASIDAGKLPEAENLVRNYIDQAQSKAEAQMLLGFILFREAKPAASLTAYKEAAKSCSPGALDLLVIGSDHLLLENYSAAETAFLQATQMDSANPLGFYYLGRVKFNQQQFDAARLAFLECLRLDPKNIKAYDNLGLSQEALGKPEEALSAYRAAISYDAAAEPGEAGPYLHLGDLLTARGQPAQALPYLLQAVQRAADDFAGHRSLAKAYLGLNQLDKAQAEAERAGALAPQNAPAHFLLMQIYRRRGLVAQAKAESEAYTALTGTHSAPETPLAGAKSLLGLGKLREAEQATRAYLKTRSNSADGHYLLAYILLKQQRAKESLAEYTEAAKYRNPAAADLEAVAMDYVLLGDYHDADHWLTRSVELNPGDSLAWYYLGRTKYNLNRFDEAISAFREALKLEPANVKAEDNLGLSYQGLGRNEEALAAFRNAISWQKGALLKDPGPFLNLGSLLVDQSQPREGLPYLLQAVQLDPKDFRAHRQLGKAYIHLNDLDGARTALEKAAELAPDDAPVHFMLGQVYRKKGMLEKAKIENDRYSVLVKSGAEK